MNDQRKLQELVHDIRNRLSVARATIEAFIDGKLAPTTDRLTSVLQTLDQLNELLEHVKSSRDSKAPAFDPIEVDVCELLKREYAAAESVAAAKGVEFAVARCAIKAQECGRFIGDPVRIGQIVSNVLTNAIKFTPAGGAVFVGCSRRADQLEISVRDSGPGIADGEGDHIFERGVRGIAAHGSAGSGFGLAIAKEFVEAHGGSITASTPEGGGARFVLRLPGTVLAIAAGAAVGCERCAADLAR
ncbi:MAG TPA: HAMP domain-containing sensor histidine kinase [Candidatus Eremiobacteraceae bacterium]|jgi:signal transduction histidine kinase